MNTSKITVETTVHAPMRTVWDAWVNPQHITQWAFASDTWEAPSATNDLRTGGRFTTRMQAKDGSAGFDFGGTYTVVEDGKRIGYVMDGEDKREVDTLFEEVQEGVHVIQSFDPENQNSIEMQRGGWQAILDNFKKYAESL